MVIICPKCGAAQKSDRECIYCGIVFDKIRPNSPRQVLAVTENRFSVRKAIDFFDAVENWFSALTGRVSEKIGIDLRVVAKSIHRTVRSWCRDVLDILMTIMVCGAVAWVICILLLYAAEGMWYLYLETQVGKQFLVHFPLRVRMIFRIINYHPIVFSFSICVVAVKACLAVAAAARVSFVARWFYENRSVIFKIVFWTPVCAAVGAWLFQEEYSLSFQASLILTLVPVLFVFHSCFELATKCLPEANAVWLFRQVKVLIKRGWQKAAHYLTVQKAREHL